MYKNIILIPYRDRKEHLEYYLKNTWIKLKEELPKSKIVIIEQEEGKLFNRGKILNVGFKEYIDKTEFFITQDVDINPTNETMKEYNNESSDIYGIKVGHENSFGGICKFRNEVIKEINGFPNNIWGWGIEDRAIFFRGYIKNIKYKINENQDFKMLEHKSNYEEYKGEKSEISKKWRKDYIDKLDEMTKNNMINFSGINNVDYIILERKEIEENVEIIKVRI